jgi:CRISPR-associated endonuclease/helicase Cas3
MSLRIPSAGEIEAFISRYWGKARGGWHPLAYHQTDVAACALAIAEARPWMFEWMADHLGREHGWDAAAVLRMLAVSGYSHDAGKHALGFQVQAPDAFCACTGVPPTDRVVAARGPLRHDALGLYAWTDDMLADAILGASLNEWDLAAWLPIASAAFGHHGHPTWPEDDALVSAFPSVMGREDLAAACASCGRFREVVGGFPHSVDETGARTVSLPLAGLLQVADWMGSDRSRFAYSPPDTPLQAYWERALDLARRELVASGLVSGRPVPWSGTSPILAGRAPTPMQEAAAAVPFDGPFLAILEDTMGSGKTEAAIILAARAMASGLAHGVFVGMPTMATADSQAARQIALRRAIFADAPSFAVTHGRSDPARWPPSRTGPHRRRAG